MDRTRRRILDRLVDGPVSGPELAASLDISRAAVWKHIEALREMGLEIDSSDGGYVLHSIPEYGGAAIAAGYPADHEIVYEETIGSTNDRARTLAADGATETLVLANEQPTGRGRLGRSWTGPPGGIYCSLLLYPTLSPVDVPVLTTVAGVAVAEALEDAGFDPSIKWPNDILVDGKKVAGVLTEMEGEADRVNWVIIGFGINANVDEVDLPPRGSSLESIRGSPIERRQIVHDVVDRIDWYTTHLDEAVDAARAYSETIGRRIRVETATETVTGKAIDIVYPGALEVETPAGNRRVHTGDCEHVRGDDGSYADPSSN